MNYNDLNKLEFLLTSQNNIICQRYFNIKNFNNKVKNSVELYEYMKYMCNTISNELKNKNAEYMLENQRQFDNTEYIDEVKDNQFYLLELRMNEVTFNQRMIPSNTYHPKVRLDIRDYLKGFENDLIELSNKKNVKTKYLKHQLSDTYLS